MTSRRRFLRSLAAATAGAAAAASRSADAPTATGLGEAAPGVDQTPTDRALAQRGTELRETATVSYAADAQRFRFDYRYALPDSVGELTVAVSALTSPSVSVLSATGFERPEETRFRWDGGPDPTLVLGRTVDGDRYNGGGYVTDEAAFATTVGTRLGWRYRGTRPTLVRSRSFDGAGHAGAGWTYAGPFDPVRGESRRTTYTVVPTAGTGTDLPLAETLDLFAWADHRLPTLLGYDYVSVFVVPSDRLGPSFPAGQTTASSILLDEQYVTLSGPDTLAAHEYVHVQFGAPGGGEMTWLSEALAEYYGAALALNTGHATVGAFLDHVRTDQYADAVLAAVRVADDTRADYRKGAHVLAALDATIRERTATGGTLLAAVTSDDHDVGTVDGFTAAVVAAADDDTMADWIERYVRTDALPDVPDDPALYTLPDVDAASFRTSTPTPSPTPSPTRRTTDPVDATTRSDGATATSTGDDASVTAPGFGTVAGGAGVALAAWLARHRSE